MAIGIAVDNGDGAAKGTTTSQHMYYDKGSLNRISTQIRWRQRGSNLDDLIGRPIRVRPPELVAGVVGFWLSHYSRPTHKKSAVVNRNATAVLVQR